MTQSAEPGDAELRAEVQRLRARNRELETQLDASFGHAAGQFARSVASVLLIVIGMACLIASPVAIWGRNLVLDTDRYVQTVEPLAKNPGVQSAIVTVVSNQVSQNLDVRSIVSSTLPQRAQVLAGPLQAAVNSLVTAVTTNFVHSKAFHTVWVSANRVAHRQLTYVLTGRMPPDAVVQVNSNGAVLLNLAPVLAQVKARLVKAGLGFASAIPVVNTTLEIAQIEGVEHARRAVRDLDTAADWLPVIGLVLTAGGILTAQRRRRALIVSALALAAGMVFLDIDLIVGRNLYLDDLNSAVLSHQTASSIFETVVRFLRWGIRTVLFVALIIAVAAWASGPDSKAVALRSSVARAPRTVGSKLDAGPVGAFVLQYANVLRIGVVALMLIILLFIDGPTLAMIILLAVITAVLLLVIEMLRAAGGRAQSA